ncbi:hypothetical protein D3C81_822140 [compost metagenome]
MAVGDVLIPSLPHCSSRGLFAAGAAASVHSFVAPAGIPARRTRVLWRPSHTGSHGRRAALLSVATAPVRSGAVRTDCNVLAEPCCLAGRNLDRSIVDRLHVVSPGVTPRRFFHACGGLGNPSGSSASRALARSERDRAAYRTSRTCAGRHRTGARGATRLARQRTDTFPTECGHPDVDGVCL